MLQRSVLPSSSLARRLATRAGMLLVLLAAGCTNSDQPATPGPDKPKPATVEAKPEAKPVAEAKPAEVKPAEEKVVTDKPAADKPEAEKAAADKPEADKAAAKQPVAKAAETNPGEAKAKGGEAPKQVAAAAPKAGSGKATKLDPPNGILAKGAVDKLVKPGQRPVIRLLEAGAKPRSPAAFALVKGTAKPLQMGMDLEMAMEAGGMKLPATSMPKMVLLFDFSTGDRVAGDWPIDGKLRKVTVESNGATQEQIAVALRPQLGSIEGLGVNYFVDEKGRVRDVKVTLPPTIPDAAEQMMSGLTQSIESMTAPLPEQAVGIGAKWEVLSRLVANGADLLQISTFTLEKRVGNVLSLDVVVQQFAAREAVNPPGMPPGTTARLTAYRSQGSGKTIIETNDVVPKGGSMTVNSVMVIELEVTDGGDTEKQETTVDTKVTASYSRP